MSDPVVSVLRLPAANAYLLHGPRPVLVDSGTAAAADRLTAALARHHVRPADLAAIVLTHGHADHAGGAGRLTGRTGPVLVGAADAAILTAGHNPPLSPTTLSARAYRPFVDRPFPAYRPDVLLDGPTDLTAYGHDARVLPAPGHTAGSVVVLAGTHLVIGDLARGGHLGGALRPHRLQAHYYSPHPRADLLRLQTLIDRHRPTVLHPGHGGPVPVDAARRRLDRLLAAADA